MIERIQRYFIPEIVEEVKHPGYSRTRKESQFSRSLKRNARILRRAKEEIFNRQNWKEAISDQRIQAVFAWAVVCSVVYQVVESGAITLHSEGSDLPLPIETRSHHSTAAEQLVIKKIEETPEPTPVPSPTPSSIPSPTPELKMSTDFYFDQRSRDLSWEGIKYYPGELDSCPQKQEGLAHFYGIDKEIEYLNDSTSSGELFDPDATNRCASWFYPIGTRLEVSYNGNKVGCIVNDRGPDRLYLYPPDDEKSYWHEKEVIIDFPLETFRLLEPNAGILPGQIGEIKVKVDLLSLPEGFKNLELPTSLK